MQAASHLLVPCKKCEWAWGSAVWPHWGQTECRRLLAQAELVFVDGHPERGPFLELWQKLFPAHPVRFLAQVRPVP